MSSNPPDSKPNPFDQYQILIVDTARLSDRRQTVNTIYVSANSLLLGALALLIQQSAFKSLLLVILTILIAAAGFALCIDWRRLILNYRDLLRLRFKLLRELEDSIGFPFPIKTYDREDELLYKPKKTSKRITFFGFSAVETRIPTVFMLIYSVGGLLIIALTVLQATGTLVPLLKSLNLLPL